MGKSLNRKSGSKRPKTPDMFEDIKSKRKRLDHQKLQNAFPVNIDDEISLEEDDASVQMPIYENLLKTLGSGRNLLEDFYCKRRIKRGGGDSNDDGAESESASASEEEVNKSDGVHSLKNDGNDQRAQLHDEIMREGRGEETADEDEIDDPNDVSDSQTRDHLLPDETKNNSYFYRHFGYVLTYDEVDKLTKEKVNFKWEMSAKEMIMSKLMGTGQDLSKELNGNLFCGINEKLHNHWKNFYSSFNSDDSCSSKWRLFFSLCNTYRDIMHCDKRPFYLKGKEDDSSIMDAYLMHAINHIHRIRERVLKNDAKLNKVENSNREEIYCGDVYLDQGFTRPKVMLLLPLASIAFRVVKRLVQLSPLSHKGNVAHMDRFSEEFGTGSVEEDDQTTDGSLESQKGAKPVDFQTLFGGNNNDHFLLGIKFTKRSIKLYSNFYSSDIIVASPLGLITKIGETEFDKEKNVDYLSSIEVLIIDHADIIAMQNWSHVSTVIEHLNHMPSKQHGTDVMRIKPWYLDGHARFYRQTILLGSLLTPDMNALFNRLCVNYEGKVKLIEKHKGVLYKVLLQVRQVYERFEASSIVDTDEARIEYFSKKVFPKMKDSLEGGTLVFISSYFEFVRIRNFLKSQNASFCLLGEYTKQSDVSRSRLWFFEGKRKIMLYTERAHFYHRYKIRGIKNLIIYSLPERKEFYPEMVNMVEGSKNMSITVLFSRFDLFRLERIVGTAAAKRMNTSDKATFVFC